MIKSSHWVSHGVGACFLLFEAGMLQAAEWDKSAGLSIGTHYSTNVCRTERDEQGQAYATVLPSVYLRGDGDRANVVLQAAAEYNSLADSDIECGQGGIGNNFSNRESWVPRLNYQGEIEAVENTFYLETDAFASQNAINPFVAGGEDNSNAVGNTNVTYRWGAGARLDRRFSEKWAAFARYNYNEQYNSASLALSNSQEDRVELDIGMIPESARLSFGVRGDYSEVTFEERGLLPEFTNKLSSLELRTALNFSDSWQINGYVGEEDNIFLAGTDEIDGSYWDVGFRWTPNQRVVVDAGWGERFFGETPRFAVSYQHKRSSLSAEYQKDLQFPRNIRGTSDFDLDNPSAPGLGIPGEGLVGNDNPTFLGQRPVLNESFSLQYAFAARRTSLSLRASVSEQTRNLVGGASDFRSASARISRRIGQATSANLRVTYIDNQGSIVSDDDPDALLPIQGRESWRFLLGLNRSLARGTSLAIQYQYLDQVSSVDSTIGNSNVFEEHVVSVSLNFNFGAP